MCLTILAYQPGLELPLIVAVVVASVALPIWVRGQWAAAGPWVIGVGFALLGFATVAASINDDLSKDQEIDLDCETSQSDQSRITCEEQAEGSLNSRIWEPVGTSILAAGLVQLALATTRQVSKDTAQTE